MTFDDIIINGLDNRGPGSCLPQSSRQNMSILLSCIKFANLVSLFLKK